VVDVQVDRAAELSGSYPVRPDGTFKMPYLVQVAALDKTREELVNLITDGLRERYLKNPRVTVVIKRMPPSRSTLFIQGSVRSPGVYQVEGRPSLLKLIANAGGLDKDHGSTAYIFREIDPQGRRPKATEAVPALTNAPSSETASEDEARYEMHTVNIRALLKGDLRVDSVIKPDDIVNIPVTDMFFVTGEVKKPGSFPLKEGMTFSQAISLAEGKSFRGSDNAMILRVDPRTGNRLKISVNIGAVTKGKKEDVLIQADDIISIPNSKLKSAADVILRGLGGSVRLPYRY
jgi:polysaccharide export outer membrane protein